MKARISCVMLALITLSFSTLKAENMEGRERIGLRIGGLTTTGQLRSNFGSGTELELHFIEGIKPWLGIGGTFSSHNFGASKNREKNIIYTGINTPVDLHIYSITITMAAFAPWWKRLTPSVESGFGLYTITTIIEAGYYEGRRTDNQFGFYGGTGLSIKLTESISIDTNIKYHYIISGGTYEHPIFFYSGSDRTHIFQITAGVILFTG